MQKYIKESNSLNNEFVSFFEARGYKKEQEVNPTDKIDPTVRFVGSHISVFKKFLNNNKHTDNLQHTMKQMCIRSHNVKRLGDNNFYPKWGSFFLSLGVINKSIFLESLFNDFCGFLETKLKIPQNKIMFRLSSQDVDFVNLLTNHANKYLVELDGSTPNTYRHKIGEMGVWGRNFNIAIQNTGNKKWEDVGNMIILHGCNSGDVVELAIGSSMLIKQIFGLNHVQDIISLSWSIQMPEHIKYKFEDALGLSILLYNYGLKIGNHNNQTRILTKYMQYVKNIFKDFNLSWQEITDNSFVFANQYANFFTNKQNLTSSFLQDLQEIIQKPSMKLI